MWERLKATGRAIKHRRLTFALVVAFLTIGVIGGLYAIQSGATFSGQTLAGDHEFWADAKGVNADAFCSNCHTAVASDLKAGPHGKPDNTWGCSDCHLPNGNVEHAAATAACTDCHSKEGGELAQPTEAHSGILKDLGESANNASLTCQTCHTHIQVTMKVYADGAVPLQMGTPTTITVP